MQTVIPKINLQLFAEKTEDEKVEKKDEQNKEEQKVEKKDEQNKEDTSMTAVLLKKMENMEKAMKL